MFTTDKLIKMQMLKQKHDFISKHKLREKKQVKSLAQS